MLILNEGGDIVVRAVRFEVAAVVFVKGEGAFSVSERAARKGRNPQTGAGIQTQHLKAVNLRPVRI